MNMTLIIFALGGGLAFILLLIGIGITVSSNKSVVDDRLGKYVGVEIPAQQQSDKQKQGALTDWLNRRVENTAQGSKISRNLARADLKLKPGEYIALMLIAAFGVGFVAWFIGGKTVLVALIGAVIGMFLPNIYVKRLQGKRLIKFNEQLGDMLNLMVNGVRAGYSTMQAMEAVSKELPAPISDEFRRVVQEMQLGVSMERALENLLRRIPSDDLDLVITAINVQREVGGNLAEILDTISFTIRERVRIKGEIRVMTSQVMYSGRFLAMLPVILLGLLYVMNREYMMEFFIPASQPCGYIALALAGILIMSGYFAMNKLADIEI
ncbi:MAG TPA: type II secretion system F family protein [Anaerolineaceae bacterium]